MSKLERTGRKHIKTRKTTPEHAVTKAHRVKHKREARALDKQELKKLIQEENYDDL